MAASPADLKRRIQRSTCTGLMIASISAAKMWVDQFAPRAAPKAATNYFKPAQGNVL
jgi:hypothetical protein